MQTPEEIAREQFLAKVEKTEDCWIWRGGRNMKDKPYGRLRVNGKQIMAHRFSYSEFVGPITKGMFVLHHCDNPPCVRPDHLFLGTNADNMRDASSKRRLPLQKHPELVRGILNHAAKLNPESAKLLREYTKTIGVRLAAKKVGISYDHARKVIRGDFWADEIEQRQKGG